MFERTPLKALMRMLRNTLLSNDDNMMIIMILITFRRSTERISMEQWHEVHISRTARLAVLKV